MNGWQAPSQHYYHQPPYAPPPQPRYYMPTEKYIDMHRGGWLTFFKVCLFFTVLGGLSATLEADQHMKTFAGFVGYLAATVGLFMVVPIAIWNKMSSRDHDTLDWIKWFEIAKIVLFTLAAMDTDKSDTAGMCIAYLINSVCWLCYFHSSERVFRTFGRNLWSSRGRTWNYLGQ